MLKHRESLAAQRDGTQGYGTLPRSQAKAQGRTHEPDGEGASGEGEDRAILHIDIPTDIRFDIRNDMRFGSRIGSAIDMRTDVAIDLATDCRIDPRKHSMKHELPYAHVRWEARVKVRRKR
jgi:hypothetical protein